MADPDESGSTKGLSVVLVDDDQSMRALLRDLMGAIGHRVIGEGDTGRRAVELFEKLKPDVICLDIQMPEMSGLEALAKIRALNSDAIVLMITGVTTSENVRGAIASGASGIIAKPFSSGKIASEIKRAIARVRSPKQ